MKKIARRSFLKIAGTVATACVVSGLSGCGAKEPLGSQSSTAGASESVTSNEVLEVASESTDSAYPTLTEVMKEYSGCGLSYPNFEELSVGMLYKGEEHKYCLFDKDGKVYHVFDEDTNVVSGFYNGMCLTGGRVMSTEDGTTFRPSYIPAEEVLVSYFKNDSGMILWSVRQEDTIEGSKTILTAWDTTDGTVRFQCDTTQPAFVKVNSNPSSLYEKMTWGFDNIIYENGGTYLIRSAGYLGNVEVNIYAGSNEASEKYNLGISGGNGTIMYIAVRDGNLESFPEWENIASKRSRYPSLCEGLIFMQAWRNTGHGEEYPLGFYDIHLNCVIDLSEYNVRAINENDEPRFMNGYAVLQLQNPDGVLFWGVMDKKGNWTAQPQKGKLKCVFPTADGVMISDCDESTNRYYVYNQTGARLENCDGVQFTSGYGYIEEGAGVNSACEVYDGYLYTGMYDAAYDSHIAKISSDGTYELMS